MKQVFPPGLRRCPAPRSDAERGKRDSTAAKRSRPAQFLDGVRRSFAAGPVKWIAGGVLFIVLATANGAGYRYGTSDQAFYIPAVTRVLDAAAFPRDAPLIDAQGRLILTDEILAGAARATGFSLDILFLCAYLLSLALIWAALVLIG